MTREQYDRLNLRPNVLKTRMLASMLVDRTNRTLIYGYTCERETFHVYLYEGVIYRVIYQMKRLFATCESPFAEACVPNKRVYPEECDYEFCMLLLTFGVDVPFTSFTLNDTQAVQVDPPLPFRGYTHLYRHFSAAKTL